MMAKKKTGRKGKWFHKMAEKEKNQQEEFEQDEIVTEETGEVSTEEADAQKEAADPETLKAENEELKDQLLRKMAEFDNFKKRTLREKDELYNFAKANCVETILGVIDNFERALQTECSDENFKKGVEMIFQQFLNTLEKLGVEEIEALNQPFNPEYHNAVNQIEDENFEENTVCQVFQKGYKIGDKVVRHAMVVVANP